jgi:hypothetical protein
MCVRITHYIGPITPGWQDRRTSDTTPDNTAQNRGFFSAVKGAEA